MVNCRICKTDGLDLDSFCEVCGYPLKGSEKEQAVFGARFIIQKGDIADSIELLKKARILLFGLGALHLFTLYFLHFSLNSLLLSLTFIITLFLGVFFLGCAFLSFSKPKIALLIPLLVVSIYYLLLLILDPYDFWTGILWKMIIFVVLAYGYFSVRKADKILKENKYIADILAEEKLNS